MPEHCRDDTGSRPDEPDLRLLNQLFRELYQQRREHTQRTFLKGEIPVVMRMDDSLILRLGHRRFHHEITGEHYHILKAISHTALAAYLGMDQAVADDATRRRLAGALSRLRQTGFDTFGEAAAQILSTANELAEDAPLSSRDWSYDRSRETPAEQFRARVSALEPALDTLLRDAVSEELQQLEYALHQFEQQLPEHALRRKGYFLVCGGHQPRYRNVTRQYYHYWLSRRDVPAPNIRHQVVYAEGAECERDALELVFTRIADSELGAVFLNSPLSLDQDVLGDAARDYLCKHGGKFGGERSGEGE